MSGVRDLGADGRRVHRSPHAGAGARAGERKIDVAPLPELVLDILDARGLIAWLVAGGYLPADAAEVVAGR